MSEYGVTGVAKVLSTEGVARTARDVGSALSDKEARDYFGSIGAFLGRYALESDRPLHRSATSEVRYAYDHTSRRDVCIQQMRNRHQFEAEIHGRFVGDVAVSPSDVIAVTAHHTPEAEPLADAAGRSREAEWTVAIGDVDRKQAEARLRTHFSKDKMITHEALDKLLVCAGSSLGSGAGTISWEIPEL